MALQMRLSLESVGVFSGRRVVWWDVSVVPGDVLAGGGGCSERWAAPKVFYVVSCPVARSQSYRGPTGPWRGRGVRFITRRAGLSCLAALWHLAVLCR